MPYFATILYSSDESLFPIIPGDGEDMGAAWFQRSCDFGKRAGGVEDVLEDILSNDKIELSVRKGLAAQILRPMAVMDFSRRDPGKEVGGDIVLTFAPQLL